MRDISLHLMDIAQNSVSARASVIKVVLKLESETGILEMLIEDNGTGMDKDFLESVIDPFTTTRTTRKIGLGIPLLKATAERSGGKLVINSQKGKGTILSASFQANNIDRPPLGDVAETVIEIIAANPGIDIIFLLEKDSEAFELNTVEIKDRLCEVPITEIQVLMWLKEYINDGLNAIFGGVLDEIAGSVGRDKEENS